MTEIKQPLIDIATLAAASTEENNSYDLNEKGMGLLRESSARLNPKTPKPQTAEKIF